MSADTLSTSSFYSIFNDRSWNDRPASSKRSSKRDHDVLEGGDDNDFLSFGEICFAVDVDPDATLVDESPTKKLRTTDVELIVVEYGNLHDAKVDDESSPIVSAPQEASEDPRGVQAVQTDEILKFTEILLPQKKNKELGDYDQIMNLVNRKRPKEYKKQNMLSKDGEHKMGLANHAFVNQDWETAIRLCHEIIKKEPYVSDPYTTLAIIFEEKNQIEKAFAYRKLESVLLPKDQIDNLMLGSMAAHCGHTVEALHYFTEVIREYPDDLDTRLVVAKCHYQGGAYKKAIEVLTNLLERQAHSISGWALAKAIAEKTVKSNTTTATLLCLVDNAYAAYPPEQRLEPFQVELVATLAIQLLDYEKALDILSSKLDLFCEENPSEVASNTTRTPVSTAATTPTTTPAPVTTTTTTIATAGPTQTKSTTAAAKTTTTTTEALLKRKQDDEEEEEYKETQLQTLKQQKQNLKEQQQQQQQHEPNARVADNDINPPPPPSPPPPPPLHHADEADEVETDKQPNQKRSRKRKQKETSPTVEHVTTVTTMLGDIVLPTLKPSIRLKVVCCHLHIEGGIDFANQIVEPMRKLPIQANLKMHQEVVSLYLKTSNYKEALSYVLFLLEVSDVPFLWCKQAECLVGLHRYDEARVILEKVTTMIPGYLDAMRISERIQQALKAGKRSTTSNNTDAKSLIPRRPRIKPPKNVAEIRPDYERFIHAIERKNNDVALSVGLQLSCCFASYKTRREKNVSTFNCPSLPITMNIIEGARTIIVYTRNKEGVALGFEISKLSIWEWSNTLLRTCMLLKNQQRYNDILAISHMTLVSNPFDNPSETFSHLKNALSWFKIISAMKLGKHDEALKCCRLIILDLPQSTRLWNLFHDLSRNLTFAKRLAAKQFSQRILHRELTCLPLTVVVGNFYLERQSYPRSAGLFVDAYHMKNNEPIICLLAGISYLRMSMQKRVIDRHLIVIEAFTFLFKYFDLRGGWKNQEACFNIARAYHQLGITGLATQFYERALELSDSKTNNNNVKTDAAYNLALIYRKSGGVHLAVRILRQHCTL